MKNAFISQRPRLAILAVVLLVAPASAQVPQDTSFTGRLTDYGGTPLAGPVDLELRLYDAEIGGNELYAETHSSVSLDVTGAFSVLFGSGDPITGVFGAGLFAGTDRWLEVVANNDVLTPRQVVASVPWALVAQQVVPWDATATPRFEDCGNGTLADHQTGLQWEKKTGTLGTFVTCGSGDCPDPNDVNYGYEWSVGAGEIPDGPAFTNFLARLNATYDPDLATGCFANRCDWNLPEISELQTILIGPEAAPGQDSTCTGGAPCIDPDFALVGGPTALYTYWSKTGDLTSSTDAWVADLGAGSARSLPTGGHHYVRAVRRGSCN